jgi:hypothetical protein
MSTPEEEWWGRGLKISITSWSYFNEFVRETNRLMKAGLLKPKAIIVRMGLVYDFLLLQGGDYAPIGYIIQQSLNMYRDVING